MTLEEVKQLVKEFREAEDTEEYDDFLEKNGEYDELFPELISFIEREVL